MTVEISDLKHLEKVMKSLKAVEGVLGVERPAVDRGSQRQALVECRCGTAGLSRDSDRDRRRFRRARPRQAGGLHRGAGGGGRGKNVPYTSFIAAKSFMSAR